MIDIASMSFIWIFFLFLFVIIFIIENYIYNKNKKKEYNEYSFFSYFYWFFLVLLFILVFWCSTYYNQGSIIANENTILFFTSYLLELLLSIDNIFVWFLIFKTFKIPMIFQKRVLLYGIWTAVLLRIFIIFYGQLLFAKYHWFLYLFGICFLFTGFKVVFFNSHKTSKDTKIKTFGLSKIFRVTDGINGDRFFFIIKKKFFVTPLFLSLIVIELSDIVFAIDSIPAIFSINDNFFIILTSNIFSVIGLRSMYFLISPIIQKNAIIEYGLSIILIFIACKILFEKWFFISTFITLFVILIILIITYLINVFLSYKKN